MFGVLFEFQKWIADLNVTVDVIFCSNLVTSEL